MPELAQQLGDFLAKLEALKAGKNMPWTFVIEDPAGNSFIKNPYIPKNDPNLKIEKLSRTTAELEEMGFSADNATLNAEDIKHEEEVSNL